MLYRYKTDDIELIEDDFGVLQNGSKSIKIKRFTWINKNQITIQVITYGATVTCIKLPDKNGTVNDIVMGFNNIQGEHFKKFLKNKL